ncbi:MAG TPA: hypothetical protein VKX16_07210 [Chloroflexota bacterium]|nr:hypothetical protein [Chloroflexota bacterium]
MDPDTFVTWLYVTVDDYCKAHVPADVSSVVVPCRTTFSIP